MTISKHLIGAKYDNPFQQPFANNDYSQNMPPPTGSGGGAPYENPQAKMDKQFFNPTTPNDEVFSEPSEVSTADPIGAVMADFKTAQAKLKNNGGK